MRRWRTIAALFMALPCLLIAVQCVQARQTTPAEPIRPEDDVIVKPKGGGGPVLPGGPALPPGFDWSKRGASLVNGRAGQFRCDLKEKTTSLKASKKAENDPGGWDWADATGAKFKLDGCEFEVIKSGENYHWTFKGSCKEMKACNKSGAVNCDKDGVAPELLDGAAEGAITARFVGNANYETVKGVKIRGAACQ